MQITKSIRDLQIYSFFFSIKLYWSPLNPQNASGNWECLSHSEALISVNFQVWPKKNWILERNLEPKGTHLTVNGRNGIAWRIVGFKFWFLFSGKQWLNLSLSPYRGTSVESLRFFIIFIFSPRKTILQRHGFQKRW